VQDTPSSRAAAPARVPRAAAAAGVFMFSLATRCQRAGAMPRPFVWVTWALGALLVLGLTQTLWAALLFPLWVLGLSLYLLWAARAG